jgi:transposase
VRAGVPSGEKLAGVVHAIVKQPPSPLGGASALRLSVRSVYRWLRAHEEKGIAGLQRSPRRSRGVSRVLPDSLLTFFRTEKELDRYASVPELLRRARNMGVIGIEEPINRVSAWRACRRMELPFMHGPKKQEAAWRRFAYPHPYRMMMVLAYGQHFRASTGRTRRVALFFIDEATNLGLHVVVGTAESASLFLRGIYEVLARYGLLDLLYLDHGPGFIADDTAAACAKLGIYLVLGTNNYPEGHSKIERFNQSVLAPMLRGLNGVAEISDDCGTLEDRLGHHLNHRYNRQPHEALNGATPLERFEADPRALRFAQSDAELRQRFVLHQNLASDQQMSTPNAPTDARSTPIASDAGATAPVAADNAPSPLDARPRMPEQRRASLPKSSTYTMRIEYASDAVGYLLLNDRDLLPNWSREFTVSGRHTLEQLSEIILDILDWDSDHLYEFRIHDRVYAHMVFLGEEDLVVDAKNPCVSCDIPIRLLGLAASDSFSYTYDYGDWHRFRLTIVDVRPSLSTQSAPTLVSYTGKNIIQYPGTLRKSDAAAFKNRVPTANPPRPARDRFRIRFIRDSDSKVLEEWRASNDKKLWQKAVTILENRNLSPEDIAKKIEQPVWKIEKWIKAFNRYGRDGLSRPRMPPKKGRAAMAREQRARRILEILHAKPSAYGINRSNWNLSSIARAYQQEHKEIVGRTTVCRLLQKFGIGIKKARKVLTSPDPDYREKVDLLLNTLQNLQPGELLFFIDELGPLRVKKYGGRAFVRKNEVLTYPQQQAHRGIIMMSGALSATTNQVTWIYGRAKDTLAMIDLIEVLYNQHFSASKIYLTWDAASWHRSAMLVEWLDVFNAATSSMGEGPIIHLVPLPTSSQFLDVIEAVFSGMKRAVIHHSDYRDVPEMKKAISLHFTERNAHFQDNPRRAGKKIWDLDFFDNTENIRSGNYRDW